MKRVKLQDASEALIHELKGCRVGDTGSGGGILTLGREYRGSRCPRHAGPLAGGNGGDKEEVKHTRVTGPSPFLDTKKKYKQTRKQ